MTPAVREESQLAAPPGRTQEAARAYRPARPVGSAHRPRQARRPRGEHLAELVRTGDGHRDRRGDGCVAAGQVAGLRAAALAIWALAAALLIALTAATIMHWLRHRQTARSHARDPVMAHFDGAPPMAVLTREHCTAPLVNEERGCHEHPDPGPVIWAPR